MIVVAACCPPTRTRPAVFLVMGRATCTDTRERTPALPAPVPSRFERPAVAPPSAVTAPHPDPKPAVLAVPAPPPVVPPAGPKREIDLSHRETLAPPPPPAVADRLPDDVVMRLLETGRAVFVRCFKKAVARDPLTTSFKVHVHVDLDGNGAITSAHADTADPELARCLTRAAGWLRFPASGRVFAVDLPLFYRGE